MGFQCVDCVRRAAAARPTPRTRFGAPASRSGRPLLTYGLIALCVVMYALQLGVSGLTDATAFAPAAMSEVWFEPWRMLTSSIVHSPGNAMHLAFNMLALWFIGRTLEPALGLWRYAALLVLSAIGGSAAVLWLTDPQTPTLGASGIVFGLFGALFVLMRSAGGQVGGIAVLLAVNLVFSFAVPNISWQGHLGGLLTGVLCAAVIAYAPRGRLRGTWQALGLASAAVLLVILTWAGMLSYADLVAG
ncbi:rhomboid family intramembrane serine protease [Nesterenkonia marinintestina]|uniref:rhomboid family intramembrane serine protease n=1 Tax=Nesterenkonia marinintestina TaxID=2979865 RepID=UPI0021BE73CE|nr:rhomboid family intramembrane serine protease [Nesterenkonia sp. GX14115]